jgi:aspartate kinase
VAGGDIFVDMIVQSFGSDGRANLSFTVREGDLARTVALDSELNGRWGCGPVSSTPQIAKLSVSGIGMRSHTDVAIRMFRALAEANINVEMINTSEVEVNIAVDRAAGERGLLAAFADVMR